MSDPRDYFDPGDESELRELLALLLDWRNSAIRDDQPSIAACLDDWAQDMQARLTWLEAYTAYSHGSVSRNPLT